MSGLDEFDSLTDMLDELSSSFLTLPSNPPKKSSSAPNVGAALEAELPPPIVPTAQIPPPLTPPLLVTPPPLSPKSSTTSLPQIDLDSSDESDSDDKEIVASSRASDMSKREPPKLVTNTSSQSVVESESSSSSSSSESEDESEDEPKNNNEGKATVLDELDEFLEEIPSYDDFLADEKVQSSGGTLSGTPVVATPRRFDSFYRGPKHTQAPSTLQPQRPQFVKKQSKLRPEVAAIPPPVKSAAAPKPPAVKIVAPQDPKPPATLEKSNSQKKYTPPQPRVQVEQSAPAPALPARDPPPARTPANEEPKKPTRPSRTNTTEVKPGNQPRVYNTINATSTNTKQFKAELEKGQQKQDTDEWKEYTSKSTGKKYYYNTLTKRTQWEKPSDFGTTRRPHPTVDFTMPTKAPSVENINPERMVHKLRKPTKGVPQVVLTVRLVDDTSKKFIVTEDFTVQDVLYIAADKLDLWQTEYFGLCITLADNTERWLNPHWTLQQEGIDDKKKDVKLTLKMKLWKHPKKFVDPVAVHLVYLQASQSIVQGNFTCPERVALQLATYQLYITYGPFNPEKHKIGYFDEDSIRTFLPPSIVEASPLDYLQRRLFALYAKLGEPKKAEIEAKYMELVKTSPLYGVTFFDVVEDALQRKLGIAEDGFLLSKKDNKKLYDFYYMDEISGWNQTALGFQIYIRNPEKKPLFDFITSSGQHINELMSEYYTLLSAQLTSIPIINIPYQPQALPDHRLFALPQQRKPFDPNFSRLELFKSNYLSECKSNKLSPLLSFLDKIDDCIDGEKVLESLDIHGRRVDIRQLDALATAVSKTFKYEVKLGQSFVENMSIKTLHLSDNHIGTEGATSLGLILEAPFPLQVLNIANTKLGLKGAQAVADHLARNKTIRELIVEENELGSKGVEVIVKAIKNNSNYAAINVTKNGLDEKANTVLADFFHRESFVGLSIAKNKLGDYGVDNLLNEIRRHSKKSLEHLDIEEVGLGKASKKFMVWLSQNSQLKSLNVSHNQLTDKAAEQLSKVLIDSLHKLYKLNIKHCGLGGDAMAMICESLGLNKKLEELKMSGNVIKNKAGRALAASLDVNKTLTVLELRSCQIKKSTLADLLKAIRKHPTLKVLDIAVNDASSNDAAKELEDLIIFHKTLEDLNIAACQLSHSGVIAVADALSKDPNLKVLHMDANKIGKAAARLAEALNNNKHLERITLRQADVSKRDVGEFFNILKPSNTLKSISLERNDVDKNLFAEKVAGLPNTKVKF